MRDTSGSLQTALPADVTSPLGRLSGVDWWFLVSTLLLAAVGLVTVHSASAEMGADVLPRQAIWVGLGLVGLFVAFLVDYRFLVELSLLLYLGGIALLVMVLLVGSERGGAQSWLGFGSLGFQPAEVAKLTTALFVARYLAGANRRVLTVRDILAAGFLVAVPVALVAVQPDMGTAAMFVPLLAGMVMVAGVPAKTWIVALLIVVLLVTGIWFFAMQDYQRDRVRTFLDPERDPHGDGYQVRQSKIAVGSGELLGKGYMQGTQSQLRFLPARHTDFVFAVLAEEWGFAGVLMVLGLYGVYIWNGALIAMRARDREGILLVVGLLSVVVFHVLYNTAMVVGLVPITGIPLPFLSYGGSFTLFNFVVAGLVLGVDARRYVNQ